MPISRYYVCGKNVWELSRSLMHRLREGIIKRSTSMDSSRCTRENSLVLLCSGATSLNLSRIVIVRWEVKIS